MHIGLGQDAERVYFDSRHHWTNKRVFIVSVILMGLFFLQFTIAHDHHTRGFTERDYNDTNGRVTFMCPFIACFVSIWIVVAFINGLMYRDHDRYGFIDNHSPTESLWDGIDVVSARVGACFSDALVSFDSDQIKDDFNSEREVQVVMKWIAILYFIQLLAIWGYIISWKALFHE